MAEEDDTTGKSGFRDAISKARREPAPSVPQLSSTKPAGRRGVAAPPPGPVAVEVVAVPPPGPVEVEVVAVPPPGPVTVEVVAVAPPAPVAFEVVPVPTPLTVEVVAAAARPSAFEYRIERAKGSRKKQARALAAMGRRGWELVSVEGGLAYFKRPRS